MMRKVLTVVLTAAVLGVVLAGMPENAMAQRPNKRARNLAKQGDQLFNRQNYQAALAKYSEAINISPVFPRAHFYKGSTHFKLGEFPDAVKELDMALAQGFPPLEVVTVRMEANFGVQNFDGAQADVDRAIAISPETAYYYLFSGRVKIAKGNFKSAVDSLKKALEKGERSAEAHYYLAIAYGGSDDLAGQETAAAEALKRGSANAGEAWYLVADSQHQRKMYQESVQAFTNSINAFKNDIATGRTTLNTEDNLFQSYIELADVYRNLNRFEDAIETAKAALSLRPDSGPIHTSLAWYFSLSGETASAISAGQKAVMLSPLDYMAHTNLCRAYNDEGEYYYRTEQPVKSKTSFNKALTSCKQALVLEPDDGETNYYLGRSFYFLDNVALSDSHYKKSVPLLEQFTKDNPNYSDGFYLLGNAYFATKQNKNAIKAYDQCLKISPRFARVRYNLGFVLIQEKDWERARKEQAVLTGIDKELGDKLLKLINEKQPKK